MIFRTSDKLSISFLFKPPELTSVNQGNGTNTLRRREATFVDNKKTASRRRSTCGNSNTVTLSDCLTGLHHANPSNLWDVKSR